MLLHPGLVHTAPFSQASRILGGNDSLSLSMSLTLSLSLTQSLSLSLSLFANLLSSGMLLAIVAKSFNERK
jgi:F0F1-type ATP synthase membrane subunit a